MRAAPRIEGFRYRTGRPVVGSLLVMTRSRPLRPGRPAGRLARTFIIALLAGTVTGLGPASASAKPASAACHAWTGPQPPSPGTENNELEGVTVLSPCDAWTVGIVQDTDGLNQTLTEHWDGTAWTVVPSPNVAGRNNILTAVRAESPTDIWAVGESFLPGSEQTLILHWDGHTWAQVASPSPGRAYLQAVRAVSATDAWAVGSFANGGTGQPLILHWNGHKWARVATPNLGAGGVLYGVAAVSAGNVWAVGTVFDTTANQSLILHWDGQKWARQTIPNPGGAAHESILFAVAAGTATGKAWAAGYYFDGTTNRTLILAWTGKKWVQQASPSPGDSFLQGVATTGTDNAWAVGFYSNGTGDISLILHWDGTAWAQVASPNPGSDDTLLAVAASAASNAWAVGWFTDNDTALNQNIAIHCC